MKRLYLLRHAKSSWSDPSLADEERPLAPRGRMAAKKMAKELRRREIRPMPVLCSSARRTQETLELVSSSLGDPTVEVEEGLYGAGSDGLLARMRAVNDSVGSVLVIGHDHGLQDLALRVAPAPSVSSRGSDGRAGGTTWATSRASVWPTSLQLSASSSNAARANRELIALIRAGVVFWRKHDNQATRRRSVRLLVLRVPQRARRCSDV